MSTEDQTIFLRQSAAKVAMGIRTCVERVQDITEEDAEREGAKKAYPYTDPETGRTAHVIDEQGTFRGGFCALWDGINAKRGCGWNANPWVWVYTFERVDKPEGWCEA